MKTVEKENKVLQQKIMTQKQHMEENNIKSSKVKEEIKQIEKAYCNKDLQMVNKSLEMELIQQNNSMIQKNQKEKEKETERTKEICRQYAKERKCKFGEGCRYTHIELCNSRRMNSRCNRPKCKFSHDTSVMCRYDSEGICKYGDGCKFVHLWKRRNEQNSTRYIQKQEQGKECEETRDRQKQREHNYPKELQCYEKM